MSVTEKIRQLDNPNIGFSAISSSVFLVCCVEVEKIEGGRKCSGNIR